MGIGTMQGSHAKNWLPDPAKTSQHPAFPPGPRTLRIRDRVLGDSDDRRIAGLGQARFGRLEEIWLQRSNRLPSS